MDKPSQVDGCPESLTNRQKGRLREYYAGLGWKPCWKCGAVKPVAEFSNMAKSGDGLNGRCRDCSSAGSKDWRSRSPEGCLEYARAWHKKNPEASRVSRARRLKRYRASHPEKAKAKNALNWAVRSGKIVRPDSCQICGSGVGVQGHHESYAEEDWLNVIWLCRKCHAGIHSINGDTAGEGGG